MYCLFKKSYLTLFCVFYAVSANAAENACARAAFDNPLKLAPIGGMGGTGIISQGGMGGTGLIPTGGMGGTGLLPVVSSEGSVAVLGVITGFASICVNGIEVHYDQHTPVTVNGQSGRLADLAVGHTVMLMAEPLRMNHAPSNEMRATAVAAFDAVAGRIDHVDPTAQHLEIMGQRVNITETTISDPALLQAGRTVRVSGHRLASGEVIATRLDTADVVGAELLGRVTHISKEGFSLNGTEVRLTTASEKASLPKLQIGDELHVTGEWNQHILKAQRVIHRPIAAVLDRAQRAVIEGVPDRQNAQRIAIHGHTVQLNEAVKNLDGAVRVEMRRVNGSRAGEAKWVAERIERAASQSPQRFNHRKIFDEKNKLDTATESRSSGGDERAKDNVRESKDIAEKVERSGSSDRSERSGRSDAVKVESSRSGSSGSGSSGSHGKH